MQTGDVDIVNRTFDIHGIPETDASLSVTNSAVNWTYRNPQGDLVRYSKTLTNLTQGERGDFIVTSPCLEQVGSTVEGGFACVSKQKLRTASCIGKILTDTCDHAKFTIRTFMDSNGVARTAILVPISL